MNLAKRKGIELRKFIARNGLFIRIPVPNHLKSLEPEITLGRSILDRALLDCLEKPDTDEWFDWTNPDFNTICFIAFLDPVQVVEKFEITIKRLRNKELIDGILNEPT